VTDQADEQVIRKVLNLPSVVSSSL
jgi:hypothetical protein